MMKSRNFHIYIGLSLAAGITAAACSDDVFTNRDIDRLPDNAIGFNVSSGFVVDTDMTRSENNGDEEEDELEPILFSDGVDSLYIHRYVAPEIERATGCNPYSDTRSTPINNLTDFQSLNGEAGFRVKAWYAETGEVFFDTTNAKPLFSDETSEPSEGTTASDTWYVSPYKYWPGKQALCFDAFAPASAENLLQNLSLEKDAISFDYSVPVSSDHKNDATVQPDLMFASSSYSHYEGTEHKSDLVPLNFRHALSAIKFAIRDVADWTIVDVSIQGVAGSGTCTFDNTNAFAWSNFGAEVNYTQTFNYKHTDPYDPDADDPHGVPTIADAPIINTPEQTFMLIPQEIPENARLVINLKYENEDGTEVSKTIEGKLKTVGIPEWEPGKEYIYTISTSSENWQYVFNVIGSRQGLKTFDASTHKWIEGNFEKNDTVIEIGAGVTEGSYYQVQSYRYRTNNPNKTEILPWKAEAPVGTNTLPAKFEKYRDQIPNMTLHTAEWLLGENWTYADEGSDTLKLFKKLSFAPQYVATDYDGDWAMRKKGNKYGSETNPVDLSLIYGNKMNTANCYVVNAGGWYSIPLYYGSSIKDGDDISATYENIDNSVVGFPSLPKFKDYAGNDITQAKITTTVKDAILVWQDAYGIIDEWKYDEKNDQIVFHVDPTYLQQANCVLAIRDANENIIWSWHIWVTDHWVNDNNLKLGVGDVSCQAENEDKGPFDFAPYNLGWCDPKNVLYIKRSGTMTFKQYNKEETIQLNERTLDVIQRADEIEYWIGNSTYYQFGRKDPMVGFINDKNIEKYNFGEQQYEIIATGDITDWILNPNAFYENYSGDKYYYNLWNNYNSDQVTVDGTMTLTIPNSMIAPTTLKKFETGELGPIDNLSFSDYTTTGEATIKSGNPNLNADFAYSAFKTVYDPSPAGYVVPPCDFFLIFGIGSPNSGALIALEDPTFFKGDSIPIPGHPPYFNYRTSPKRDHSGEKTIIFNVNGQKRRPNYYMNPCVVYLWSNTNGFYSDWSGPLAFGYALGYDTNGDFALDSYFQGSRLIARPVRCIKEPNTTLFQ